MYASNLNFQPTEVTQFITNRDTGAGTLLVETDAGRGYLKALGNPDSPHALVKEFIGTHLAAALGLPTFDYAIVEISEIDILPFFRNGNAEPGPAFVTRAEIGQDWGQDRKLLRKIDNPAAVSGLVVVDTWLRNTDRFFPPANRVNLGNVFFTSESTTGLVSLKAMDFSHCIRYGGELTEAVRSINDVRDEHVFGLFPEFKQMLDRDAVRQFASTLGGFTRTDVEAAVALVPREWYLEPNVRTALVDFLIGRASFVSQSIESWIFGPTQLKINLSEESES